MDFDLTQWLGIYLIVGAVFSTVCTVILTGAAMNRHGSVVAHRVIYTWMFLTLLGIPLVIRYQVRKLASHIKTLWEIFDQ